jgi:hypothetical protein
MSEQTRNDERVADDVLRGAAAIADELGTTEEQIYYEHAKREKARRSGDAEKVAKTYPIVRVGKLLMASRRELRRTHRNFTSST